MALLKAVAPRWRSDAPASASSHAHQETTNFSSGFAEWLEAQQGRQYDLHSRYINPAFVRMLKTIGFR